MIVIYSSIKSVFQTVNKKTFIVNKSYIHSKIRVPGVLALSGLSKCSLQRGKQPSLALFQAGATHTILTVLPWNG